MKKKNKKNLEFFMSDMQVDQNSDIDEWQTYCFTKKDCPGIAKVKFKSEGKTNAQSSEPTGTEKNPNRKISDNMNPSSLIAEFPRFSCELYLNNTA